MVAQVSINGHPSLVPVAALELGRRLREGDATVGWEGDPTLSLEFDPVNSTWQVWGRDLHGETYCCGAWPHLDGRILRHMVEGHWRNARKTIQKVIDARTAREKAAVDSAAEARGAWADKLGWAAYKDAGIHDFHSMYIPGRS